VPPERSGSPELVALAGGVGAARFLRGLEPGPHAERLTTIVNTGDDRSFYGVHVSPDIDIVSYTLSGRVDVTRGYGLEGDSFQVIEQLGAFGHEIWFRLGDRDFAICQHRTLRLANGAGIAEVTREIAHALGVRSRLLPMSEDPCPTIVELEGGRSVHFEEYLARDGAPDEVVGVDLSAARDATPGPGVLDAIAAADVLLVCPSNPVVSIAPILAVPGIREAVAACRAPVIAVSPIVGGAPVKGPADRLLRGLGHEVSARGVAKLYCELIDGYIIDERDAALEADIAALGLRTCVMDTIMRDVRASQRLAEAALALAADCR
jgi:LPPG:FO 2-phospho-L-lactate transferase